MRSVNWAVLYAIAAVLIATPLVATASPSGALTYGTVDTTVATPEPYSRLHVQPGITYNTNRTQLHEDWQPGFGPQLVMAVPFYAGYLEAVAAFHIYRPLATSDVPAFNALMLQLGWGLEQPMASWLTVAAGVRVGNYGMGFDTNGDLERAEVNESELVTAAQVQLAAHLTDRWSLVAATSYQRTFTRIRMDLVYATVGLRYSFDSPSWLQTLLR